MFFNIILFILIALLAYESVNLIHEKNVIQKINKYINEKNDKYYEEYIRNFEKRKKVKLSYKLNIFHKINLMIDRASLKRGILINPITVILSRYNLHSNFIHTCF